MILACPQCRSENDARRRFCNACGVTLERLCLACGFANRVGDRFCGGCGMRLDRHEATNGAPLAIGESTAITVEDAKRDELRTITVMMADLDGFAEMTERLGRERQTEVMNQVFERLANEHIVRAFDGYVDKFLDGDIMALFGAPIAHEDAPERALRAAVRMHTELRQLHADGTIPASTPLRLRIGLNTGPVRVGGVGAGGRVEYTAMGDTVNLAARLMTACEWGSSLISSNTHRRVKGSFELEELPPVKVKGKSQPVPIWSVQAERRRAARIELAQTAGMSRMVGREALLQTVMAAYQRAEGGAGNVVGIRGEAGIGKSRLVFELTDTVGRERVRLLEGRCLSYGTNLSYLPAREVVSQVCGIDDADAAATRDAKIRATLDQYGLTTADLAPALAFVLGFEPDDAAWQALEPQERRDRIEQAFVQLLLAAATERVLLVFFDDLQWIDADSAELLAALARRCGTARVLLLCAYRTDYAASFPVAEFTQIEPGRLTVEETRAVVGSLLRARHLIEDEGRIDESLAAAVYRKSQGNPFFIDQTVSALVERAEQTGHATIDFRRGRLLITEDELSGLVPDSVEEILLARLDKLPSEPRSLLQAASVTLIGRYFRRSALEFVLEGQDLGPQLELLARREMIHREDRDGTDEEYVFEHALARDVAYNALLRAERRKLHGRMGEYIEHHYAASLDAYLDDLSYHYYNSANAAKAVVYLPRSAHRARQVYSNQQAILLFKRAVEKADELTPDDGPLDVLRLKVDFIKGMHGVLDLVNNDECLEWAHRRMALARETGDRELIIDAAYSLANVCANKNDFAQSRVYWDQVLTEYEAIEAWEGVRDTEFGIGNLDYLQGNFDEALKHFQRALQIQLERLEFDAFGQWVAYNNLAAAYEATSAFEPLLEACDTCERLLATMPEDDPMRMRLQCYTSGNLGSAHRNLGNLEQALASYATTLQNAQATGERNIEAEVRNWLGRTLALMGRLGEAQAHLDEAVALSRETGHTRWELAALAEIADVQRLLGQFDAAEATLAAARAAVERVGEVAGVGDVDLAAGRLALARGDAPAAAALASHVAGSLADGHGSAERAAALLDLAAANLAQGETAASELTEALALAQRMGLKPLRARGLLLRAQATGAADDAAQARALAETCGLVEERVAALAWHARLTAETDVDAARADLREAEALLAAMREPAGEAYVAAATARWLAPARVAVQ